jgi:molybdate transport system ATP-binding protein
MEMLRLDNIALTVGDFSLHNIDFAVEEGEYFILLGPSGAGKSIDP